jgi:hypothetical protein
MPQHRTVGGARGRPLASASSGQPGEHATTPATCGRGANALAPLCLYLGLAAVTLFPLFQGWRRDLVCGDWVFHLNGVLEARDALAEGQFPIRIAPSFHGSIRYGLFQFYGQLPYTLPAVLNLAGVDAWSAVRLCLLLALSLGGLFLYFCARSLTGSPLPSLAAGACFVCGPYLLTAIHCRLAYTEVLAVCLLPAVLFGCLRALTSRATAPVLLGGVAWGLLALSHNITFLYASAFFGLYIGSHLLGRRHFGGVARVGLAYGLGLLLSAWYIVPQLFGVHDLRIGTNPLSPASWNFLTPLRVLLSPTPRSAPVPEGTPLPLQVGWPVLMAVLLAACSLLGCRPSPDRDRPAVARLLLLFGLAFLLAWAPVDFWEYLPPVFRYVQFSYRLLGFALLWGSLLAAYALTWAFGRAQGEQPFAACLLLVLLSAAGYLPAHPPFPSASGVARAWGRACPDPLDYAPTAYALAAGAYRHDRANLVDPGYWVDSPEKQLTSRKWGYVPSLEAGDVLRLEGRVLQKSGPGVRVRLNVGGVSRLDSLLPPGPFALAVAVPRGTGGRPAEFELCPSPVPAPGGKPLLELSRLTVARPGGPDSRALVSAEELLPAARFGRKTFCHVKLTRPALVQLPVLFYKGLLRVRDNGMEVTYGNLGRFVAVEVGPGKHMIDVRFAGTGWANCASAAAWVGVLAAFLTLVPWPGRTRGGTVPGHGAGERRLAA